MPTSSNPHPRVLVADPDVAFTALIGRQLEWAGYEVLTTGESDNVLDVVARCRPDAVMLEAQMPGISGYALVRQLREQPENRLMPIVMISARAGKLDSDFALQVGADAYLRKPVRLSDVVARLALLTPAGPATEHAPVARRGLGISRPALRPALA
jgi:CheY-like chemotaxis protein